MANGQGFRLESYGNWPCCERYGQEDSTSEIRPSDQFKCESCWYEKDDELNIDDLGNVSDEEMYDQLEAEDSSLSALTVVQQADEANKESQIDPTAPNDHDNTNRIIIKKSSNSTECKCQKCDKKVVNGVICSNCERKYHWRCGGITKDDEKAKVMQSNNWECYICRSSDKECLPFKDKDKEVRNLKANNVKLEKKLDNITHQLKLCQEGCIHLEDRLHKEKKLR